MKRIKLTKAWADKKAGDVIEVDDERAARLIEEKLGKEEKAGEAKNA